LETGLLRQALINFDGLVMFSCVFAHWHCVVFAYFRCIWENIWKWNLIMF